MFAAVRRFALPCSALLLLLSSPAPTAVAQDAFQGIDMTSDAFTKAEMTRDEIAAGLAGLADGATLDLSAKALNGLDLSGLDLRRAKLDFARLNKASLKGS